MEVTKPYKFIGFGAMDVTKPYAFIRFGTMDVTKPYEYATVSLRRFDRSVFQHVLFFENEISMLEGTTDGPLCRRNPTPFTHDSGWWETTPGVQPVLVRPTGRADRPGRLAGSRGRAQHYESLDPRATLYIMERFVNVSVVSIMLGTKKFIMFGGAHGV